MIALECNLVYALNDYIKAIRCSRYSIKYLTAAGINDTINIVFPNY
jgi:hypothetical protein